ncbi:conserved exported hypothetical protein [Candidatus Accumulibacter aalborgensis]|uniref:DUF5666 domain-containing protein n=1 Tax=Candidatus Accumulibacter aalborgensis TaxID=1860102 RepID=A0A1A8XYV9_9PROT|nr:hypothetical protein [Candidatus Accumulibacter aalborgensis]SBT09862.1 conserved exported hypothetical protein [Candidatus Accumulibacter aalborgensis]
MRIRIALATAALVLLPLAASAQQAPMSEGLTAVAPGKFAGMIQARGTLVVDSIDKATRSVVLRNAKGETTKVVASDKVKNFDQIKVGDNLVVTYTQGLVMTLKKGGGALRERIDSSETGSAAKGEKPAGYEVKEVTFVADVQQVDLKHQTITLRGATRIVRLKINDLEQLKLIKKGDQVEGVFAEAVAVSVVPAHAKAKK